MTPFEKTQIEDYIKSAQNELAQLNDCSDDDAHVARRCSDHCLSDLRHAAAYLGVTVLDTRPNFYIVSPQVYVRETKASLNRAFNAVCAIRF